MKPTKYSEFHTYGDAMDQEQLHATSHRRKMFDLGSSFMHAYYLVEMSFRHPIMYFLFYRWWIPLFLLEEQKENFGERIKHIRSTYFRPYWAEFSLRHPVQYCLFWIVFFLFEFIVKLFTAPIKIIKRFEKIPE